jgi:hypothetical protein
MWQSMTAGRSPWRGVWLLLTTVTATELAMLNIIFWAQAQGTLPGLMLAVVTPWALAFAAPLLVAGRRQRLPLRTPNRLALHPRLSLGLGVALAASSAKSC